MASTSTQPPTASENNAAGIVSTGGSNNNSANTNYYNVDKLEGMSNYNTWKFCMKMALTLENVWSCTQGTDVEEWKDQRALARICLAVKPHCYQYVHNAKTSQEAWTNLAKVFEDKGLYRRVLLLRQLHRVELTSYSSVTQYVDAVMTLVQQLADIGKDTEDGEIAELLLSGLPENYDHLVTSLETVCLTGSLSSELVRSRLLQEEFRKSEPGASTTAFVSRQQIKTCSYCKKKGHLKAKCFKLRRDKKNKEEDGEKTFVASAFYVNSQDWVVDSGCSTHMCNNRSWLSNFKDCKSEIKIANNEQISCLGSGEVILETDDLVKVINNVSFVPELSINLLSVSKLCEKGFTVTFNKKGCHIYEKCVISGNSICKAYNKNGIYKLSGKPHVPSTASTCGLVAHSSALLPEQEAQSANIAEVPIDVWHRRLGHLGVKGMLVLRNGVANGVLFQFNHKEELQNCIPCMEGKMAAKPFPTKSHHRASQPLELIHSDVCGPMPVASWGGARYLVTFTDDFTRKSFGYLLQRKNEVFSTFIDFKSQVEKQLGFPIKILRSDNGGEYCNSNFSDYFKKEGIVHQTTIPYCPQGNGVSERLNRTLLEKARCMLRGAGLEERFWGEAVMTAIYLKNRSPTSSLSDLTPQEKWTGSRPDLSHLRIFGCIAYSLIPEQRRNKLGAKSKMYLFVGYSETSKGYRLADPANPTKVIISRNVAFIENKFYETDKVSNSNNSNNFMFYELSNNINKSSHQNEPGSNISILDSSTNVELNSSINSNLPNSSNDREVNPNIIVSDTETSKSEISDADEYYCTGSENEDGSSCSPIADAPSERVTSPHLVAPQGEVQVAPEPSPSRSSARPVRSTRSKLPLRYEDYETDFSLVAHHALPGDPHTYEEAISCADGQHWQSAMQCEYNSLIANNVWEIVDRPPSTNVIKCKWVYKRKHDASGKFDKFKARLVARGFTQVRGIDYNETFSPVVRHSTMRILFSLANELDLSIDHVDVTTAFLNGKLDETIYMEQPPGFSNNDNSKVCLLSKGIYGLKQASRIWNAKVHTLLSENGYKQSKCEPCVYSKKVGNDLIIIALYVDDFYIFYSCDKNELLPLLENNFSVKNLGSVTNCLGMNVYRDRVKHIIKLDQSEYINKLLIKFGMDKCKPVSTPMVLNCKLEVNESEHLDDCMYSYRELLGSLMYLSVCTRPDIAFSCSQLSQFSNNFNRTHWLALKRILRYLGGTINYCLCFNRSNNLSITAFSDADWANDIVDRKSYTGFVVKLGCNTISWESRKQRCVALSSTEAEYLSISDVCKDLCFIRNFLSEIVTKDIPITLFNDNQSAHKLLECKEYCHKRTKHIDLRYHYVKDLVRKNFLIVKYLPSDQMIADVLTKALGGCKHKLFTHEMNVIPK